MNKPILMPQLSATRARTGMRSLSELITLLLKQYELQDQLRAKQQAASAFRAQRASEPSASGPSRTVGATAEFSNSSTRQGQSKPVQATFAWFEGASAEPAGV